MSLKSAYIYSTMSVVIPTQVQKSPGGKPTKNIAEISMSVGCLWGGNNLQNSLLKSSRFGLSIFLDPVSIHVESIWHLYEHRCSRTGRSRSWIGSSSDCAQIKSKRSQHILHRHRSGNSSWNSESSWNRIACVRYVCAYNIMWDQARHIMWDQALEIKGPIPNSSNRVWAPSRSWAFELFVCPYFLSYISVLYSVLAPTEPQDLSVLLHKKSLLPTK